METKINSYSCVINGNNVVLVSSDKRHVVRCCEHYANRGCYTELWFCNSDGVDCLINFWN